MTSSIRTMSEALQQQAAPPQPPRIIPLRNHFSGAGEVLSDPPVPSTRQPVSAEEEIAIRSRIQALIQRGCAARIQAFQEELRRTPLSIEARAETDRWSTEFAKIAPDNQERRALSLGVLIIRVIRPSRLQEGTCRDILQQLLPAGESVDRLLQDCEHGLELEKQIRERSIRTDRIAQTQLARSVQVVKTQMAQELTAVQQGLMTERAEHREMSREMNARADTLRAEVEQRAILLTAQATAAVELKRREVQGPQFHALLDECTAILED